jgi:hypothetical protein
MGSARRRGLGLVIVVGLACACTNEAADDPPPEGRERRATTTTAAPRERADLAGLDAAGVEARRIEPDLGEGERFAIDVPPSAVPVRTVGDTLLAWVSPGDGTGHHLQGSDDLGASWEPVELPHAPGGLRQHEIWEAGDRVVVIASTSDVWEASDGYIWTSDDGVTWLGGPVTAVPPDADLVDPPAPLPDGRLAIAIHRPDQPQAPPQALVTDDDGASWQLTDCPDPWLTDAGCDPPPNFDGLGLRGTEVSLDQGATWRPIVFTPTADGAEPAPEQIQTAVASPGGGWLGLGTRVEQGTNRFWSVVRSNDGVTWETILGDACSGTASRGVASVYGEPVPLGDRWVVTHTCFAGRSAPRSEIYLLDHDGSNPRPVASTEEQGLHFDHTGAATLVRLRP